jgi:hypothetical protein
MRASKIRTPTTGYFFTVDLPRTGEVLGGIEWGGQSETDPDELPAPEDLAITVAGR